MRYKSFCISSTVLKMMSNLNKIIKLSIGFSLQKANLQFFMELNMYLLLKKVSLIPLF